MNPCGSMLITPLLPTAHCLGEGSHRSILNGNLTLDPKRPLTQTKLIPDPSDNSNSLILDNDIIGDVILKAINSITKEELDALKEDPKKFEKIQNYRNNFLNIGNSSRLSFLNFD